MGLGKKNPYGEVGEGVGFNFFYGKKQDWANMKKGGGGGKLGLSTFFLGKSGVS